MIPPSIRLIVACAAVATGTSERIIMSDRRDEEAMVGRRVVYLLAVELTELSDGNIAHRLGRDRSTVKKVQKHAAELYATDDEFRTYVDITRAAVLKVASTPEAAQFADPDPSMIALAIKARPAAATMLRVSATDTQAMAYRLLALEEAAGRTVTLLRLIDELCAGTPGEVRRRSLARAIRPLIFKLGDRLKDLNIKEIENDSHDAAADA
jgi:hypothetical protein